MKDNVDLKKLLGLLLDIPKGEWTARSVSSMSLGDCTSYIVRTFIEDRFGDVVCGTFEDKSNPISKFICQAKADIPYIISELAEKRVLLELQSWVIEVQEARIHLGIREELDSILLYAKLALENKATCWEQLESGDTTKEWKGGKGPF